MPGQDQTGPAGQGPMTGKGFGQCGAGNKAPTGRGMGRGAQRGFGRGMGRCGRGRGMGFGPGRGGARRLGQDQTQQEDV